jgi:4-hydroxy-4-methyl-2-oxoglutarate aldolase
MDESAVGLTLGRFATATLCDASGDVQAMRATIRPLFAGAKLCGPAKTVKCGSGQNAAIHRAVDAAAPGEVLVVDASGDKSVGSFGDLLAACCRNQEIAGLVIDGAIRDSAAIGEMGFPVFSLGTSPRAAGKCESGAVDVEISCGGIRVRPGDYVVGDADGVAVVPVEIADAVVERAAAILGKEDALRRRLATGETTFAILGLDQVSPGEGATARPLDFFNLNDPSQGTARELAPGLAARIFAGERVMLSVVTVAPNAAGDVHSHPQEQWGVLLEGDGVRIQDGVEIPVGLGDFWRTPSRVSHGFRAGPRGARLLDVFSAPREEYAGPGAGFGGD